MRSDIRALRQTNAPAGTARQKQRGWLSGDGLSASRVLGGWAGSQAKSSAFLEVKAVDDGIVPSATNGRSNRMPEAYVNAPPLRWLLAGHDKRLAAFRYWIRDTAMGLSNTGAHKALGLLPTDMCSDVGALLGRLSRYRYPESDARARRLIAALYLDYSPDQIDRSMRRLWAGVGRTMAEYSVLDRLWPEGRIRVEGMEHVTAARQAGKPVVIAALHLGNWEAIGPTIINNGFTGSVLYEVPENRFDHRIALDVRRRCGATLVFPDKRGGRIAYQMLRDNRKDGFAIFIDEIFRGQVSAPAFGRERVAEGNIAHVARLARLTGAVVIPTYCLRTGEGAHFTVHFMPPVDVAHTADRRRDLSTNVARIERAIEPVVRNNIEQWYYALDYTM